MKIVYALDMSNDTVKIGVTQNLAKRIATIENASGLTVRRHFESKPLNDDAAFTIERACHETFADARIKGEFFASPFEKAVVEINRRATACPDAVKTERRVAAQPDSPAELSARDKIQFLLEAAKIAEGAMRYRFLLKIEALIDGRELDDFDDSPAADFVADFLDKHCVRDKDASVPRPQLVRLIREHCPEAENVSRNALIKTFRNIDGLKEVKIHGTWYIKGIRLIEDADG